LKALIHNNILNNADRNVIVNGVRNPNPQGG
jgi:hypothetical protein